VPHQPLMERPNQKFDDVFQLTKEEPKAAKEQQ
jgi:hypothetical protein